MTSFRERRLYGALVLAGLLGAVALSVASGRPADLPGIALGSAELLHVEKAAAAFAAYLFALVVLVRAFAGELPSELRGLKYAVGETREGAGAAFADLAGEQARLRQRLENVEALVTFEHLSKVSPDGKEEQHV